MIEIARTTQSVRDWHVKIVGVGGAGSHAVDKLSGDGFSGGDLIVANTDSRALSSSITATRIGLGQKLTRGLGTGGDPDLGRAAAEESLSALTEQLAGASLVIVLTGLGGGTGSGSAPRIVAAAKDLGAQVVVLGTLPFSFEGKRRMDQALDGLSLLRNEADLVVCFENDRMSSLVDGDAGIEEAFAFVDGILAEAVRALVAMTQRKSVMHSSLDEIASVLSGPATAALFGYGIAEGDDRCSEALDKAMANPLLNFEGQNHEIRDLWLYVAGGSDLRWAEVQLLTSEVNRRFAQNVRLFFGAAVDPQLAGQLAVTLIAGVPSLVERGDVVSTPVMDRTIPRLVRTVASPILEVREKPEPVLLEEPSVRYSEPEAELDRSESQHELDEAVSEPVLALQPEIQPEPVASDAPMKATAETLPEPEVSKSVLAKPPFERTAELRRDIGASFLKRRLMSRGGRSPEQTDESGMSEPFEKDVNIPPAEEGGVQPAVQSSRVPVEEAISRSPVVADEHAQGAEQASGVQGQSGGMRTKPSVQEQMHFEPVNRGRFEKTDPTMVDGQDLDVPTFLRRRVSIGGDAPSSNATH